MIGTFSRLGIKCRECSYVDECDEKRMELCAVKIEEPIPVPVHLEIKMEIKINQDTPDKITDSIAEHIRQQIGAALIQRLSCGYVQGGSK